MSRGKGVETQPPLEVAALMVPPDDLLIFSFHFQTLVILAQTLTELDLDFRLTDLVITHRPVNVWTRGSVPRPYGHLRYLMCLDIITL